MTQRAFITGATGFIGSRLANRLINQNIETHITVRATSNMWRIKDFQQKLTMHQLDLHDQKKVHHTIEKIAPDYVFNLACYGGFPEEDNHLTTIQTNVIATRTLLEACARSKVKRFLHLGSSSEYGIQNKPMAEKNRENPHSIYGITKLSATHLTRWYAEENGLPTTILRIFSPYGNFDDPKRLIPSVIRACLEKRDIDLGSGKQVRDFIYIEDLIDALLLFLDLDKNKALGYGEIINLGSGKQHSILEVVETILSLCQYPIKPRWGMLPDRKNEPQHWVADITKSKNILGWQPKTTLQDGLKTTVNWTKQQWENRENNESL